MLVIAGSYDRLFYGLEQNGKELVPSFIYPAHLTCITCLDCTPKFLATGATDEHIKVYDLLNRKEVGTLMHHSGTITAVRFFKKSHLITASDDGTIAIVRTSDWEVLKTLTGHKGKVNDLVLHSSGKVLASVGKDKTFKLWDLTKGLMSLSTNLRQEANQILWSSSGLIFIIYDKSIEIQNLENKVMVKIESSSRINGACLLNEFVCFGGEDKIVRVYDATGKLQAELKTMFETRVKDLASYRENIAACSSEGFIQIWEFKAGDFVEIANYNAKCRLTCLAMIESTAKPKPKKQVEYPQSESEYEEATNQKLIVELDGKTHVKRKRIKLRKN